MSQQQIGKVWTTIGLFLAYYALNSWIVSQGGKEIFGAKLIVDGKTPAALMAIIICGVLIIVNSLIGRAFAQRSKGNAWHERIPVVLLDPIETESVEGRVYQGFMFAVLSVLPTAALVHFWQVVMHSKIATTDDPPKPVESIWDWTHFSLSDPARICTTYAPGPPTVCGQNATVLPGLEPILLALLTAAAVFALLAHARAVFLQRATSG